VAYKLPLHAEEFIDVPQKPEGEEDLKIWRNFKAGDERAFVLIYKSNVNRLFQIGLQVTQDESVIKDCLQDFFIELKQKPHNLSDTDNIALYLIKSFRRKLIRTIKRHNKFIFKNEWHEAFSVELAVDEKIIESQYNAQRLKRLENAMNKLSAKDREVIYYYYYQNMSYAEIAKIMDYTHIASARRTVYKILKRLKKLMSVVALLFIPEMSLFL